MDDESPPGPRRGTGAVALRGRAVIAPITFNGDEAALVTALRGGHPGAAAAFYERYAADVHRTLARTLGPDPDLPDLLQEVFITAIDEIGKLSSSEKLGPWLTSIAVFTARACIRRRHRRRWLSLFSPEQAGPRHQPPVADGAREALRAVYDVLDRFPADERIAFSLRIIDGLPLAEAAQAARTSLATFKRRLARAEKKFLDEAARRPALGEWLDEGDRWGKQGRA